MLCCGEMAPGWQKGLSLHQMRICVSVRPRNGKKIHIMEGETVWAEAEI